MFVICNCKKKKGCS